MHSSSLTATTLQNISIQTVINMDTEHDDVPPEEQTTPSVRETPSPEQVELASDAPADTMDSELKAELDEVDETQTAPSEANVPERKKRRRRVVQKDMPETRLLGRRSMCKTVADIAPSMLKQAKIRVMGQFLESTRGLDDQLLTQRLIAAGGQITAPERVISQMDTIDANVDRRTLKDIILNVVLLQEETYGLEESKLDAKVREYEQTVLDSAASSDFFDVKKHDPVRIQHCETYRVVLDAAWRNNDDVSFDEAALLAVLRERLGISAGDHRLIAASLGRFPRADGQLHTNDEIHDARKQLQREGVLWSYRDENNRNIDVIPAEVAECLRRSVVHLDLQRTNFRRLLEHDSIRVTELRDQLGKHGMDRGGNKAEMIERIVASDIRPSALLDDMDRARLSDMCRIVGLKSSGTKQELIDRLIGFYDDLSFVERESQDEREEWYNNFELLAARAYSDLRAKKLIQKDLEIEHQFEKATDFLFETQLNLAIDNNRTVTKADGRILLPDNRVIIWDCKSCESPVNLQDYLESQFSGYLHREREKGFHPLAVMVIGPSFSPQSVKLAHQYKARTNWDVALVEAAALKHLAEQWSSSSASRDQAFPIALFNRTEIIDVDRADFLLSLA